MNNNENTTCQPTQIATRLSIDPLILESAKITLANTGIDLSVYIEASLRQLVQKDALPFSIDTDPVLWAEEESIRKSVKCVTTGLYLEASELIDRIDTDIQELLLNLIAQYGALPISATLIKVLFTSINAKSALYYSNSILAAQLIKKHDLSHFVDSLSIYDEDEAAAIQDELARKFLHYSETIEHQVSQFLLDHSIEVEQASCNALSPESELTTQNKLDLFDTCFFGVLDCYKRNSKRFTAYLNYYGKTPLIEKIKNDLPAIDQSLQNASKE